MGCLSPEEAPTSDAEQLLYALFPDREKLMIQFHTDKVLLLSLNHWCPDKLQFLRPGGQPAGCERWRGFKYVASVQDRNSSNHKGQSISGGVSLSGGSVPEKGGLIQDRKWCWLSEWCWRSEWCQWWPEHVQWI
ncbi:hypothetical protein P4S72_16605 [Vibrio sp. PP-XX7]